MEEQVAGSDPLIGAQVGNYTVKSKLGEGGMGSVYMAEHPLIGKKVALKVLHAEFSSNEDVVSRFFNEARAVNDIQHPNIVDIIDYGVIPSDQGGNMVYFIMEFLDGKALSDIIAEEAPLDPARALNIAMQVADSLAASHRSNIVHRDLKPDNIIIIKRRREENFVKVLDFGIAKLTGDQPGSRRTRTGIVMGTPAYMSPEQCEGKGGTDHRTDVYALGVVVYEMLTGRTPFVGEGYGEILVQHLTQPPTPLSTIRQGIPPHVEQVVLKALEKGKEARYQKMEDMMAALQDPVSFVEANGGLGGFLQHSLADGSIVHTPVPGTGPMTPAPMTPAPGSVAAAAATHWPTPAGQAQKKRTGIIVGGIVGVIALAAVLALALGGGGEEEEPEEVAAEVPPPEEVVEPEVAPPVMPDAGPVKEEPKKDPEVEIVLKTQPEGASVIIDGEQVAVTPEAFKLPKSKQSVEVELQLAGYKNRTVKITPNRNLDIERTLRKVRRRPTSRPTTKTDRKTGTKRDTRTGGDTLRPE